MAHADHIAGRMSDYFSRQIALYDEMLAAYATLPTDLHAEDLEALTERQAAFTHRSDQLKEEFRLLMRDWLETDSVSDVEREHVRGLARHAEALARRLEGFSHDAANQAGGRLSEVKRELDALRCGHRTLNKYRGDGGTPGYMDTKA
jgi:hypothetical protein